VAWILSKIRLKTLKDSVIVIPRGLRRTKSRVGRSFSSDKLGNLQRSLDPYCDFRGPFAAGKGKEKNEGREEKRREGREGDKLGKVGPSQYLKRIDVNSCCCNCRVYDILSRKFHFSVGPARINTHKILK